MIELIQCMLLLSVTCRQVNIIYGICPKISNNLFYTFLAQILLFMQLFPKTSSGIANIVDPDQTAPEGAV